MSDPSPPLSSFWRTQLRQWHWISSALCLAGLLLFAVTGFTLNHATQIEAKPKTVHIERDLAPDARVWLSKVGDKAPLPEPVKTQIKSLTGIDTGHTQVEKSDEDLFIDLTQPGIDASITIEADGHVTYDRSDRGLIALLNDLHKGRHAGPAWAMFIDVLAIACVIFSVTGLGLLWLYGRNRAITWPLVGFGLLLPFIVFMIFVHA